MFVTPQTVAHQAPLSMEFSRQEYWSGLPCPPPGDLPDPGIQFRSPALQADSLPAEPPEKSRHFRDTLEMAILAETKDYLFCFPFFFLRNSYCCAGGLPWWLRGLRICLQCKRPELDPWVGNIPRRSAWQPTEVLLPGESHGQRSLVGYSPWGRKESDTAERLTHSALEPGTKD